MQKQGGVGLVSYMTLEMVGKEDSEFESAAKKRNVVRTFSWFGWSGYDRK